jgi:glycosyltransferase involved in cell wall biosynthesis
LRDERRTMHGRYSVIKNRLYFAMRHALVMTSFYEVIQDVIAFIDAHREDYRRNVDKGYLTQADLDQFDDDVHRAFDAVLGCIRKGTVRTRPSAWFAARQLSYLPFATRLPVAKKLHLCFFSQEYPPGTVGGIGRFTRELAVGLAELGHHIHVLTRGKNHHTVDLEDGVWVHRIVPEHCPRPAEPAVPQTVWDYSASLTEELLRIHRHRPVDLVELPLWDSEGIAAILDGTVPAGVSLHTPLPTTLEISPYWKSNPLHYRRHIRPLLALEPFCLARCDFILANSRAVVVEVERGHEIRLERHKLGVVPHGFGVPVEPAPTWPRRQVPGLIEVLFVGRLERRKGIDLLLDAVLVLIASRPGLRFTIVGEDSIPGPRGRTYRQEFGSRHPDLVAGGTVRFMGSLPEEQLDRCYAECDIFVAPSRYESFGLVLVEAMRHGKPVIACNIGGMREVLVAGETGLLVPPEDSRALADAILRLADDDALRERLGRGALVAYLETFTRAAAAGRAKRFYDQVLTRLRARSNAADPQPIAR